jgi:hypothetical protein
MIKLLFHLLIFTFVSCNSDGFKTDISAAKIAAPFYKSISTVQNDQAYSVLSDANGNNYIIGSTEGALAEANGGGGLRDIYVSKTNLRGVIQWTKQIGAVSIAAYNTAHSTTWSANGSDYPSEIKFDSQGNLIIAACTTGSLGGTNANDGVTRDLVMIKMTTDGSITTIKQLGTELAIAEGLGATTGDDCGFEGDIYDQPSMALDTSDNIYVASYTDGDLGEVHASADGFVVKFDSNLDITWLKHYGTVSVPAEDPSYSAAGCEWPTDILLDKNGHPHIVGYSWCNATTVGGPSQGASDMYWSKLNKTDGDILFIKQTGGDSWDNLQAMTLDKNGNIIAVGGVASTTIFGATHAGGFWDFALINYSSTDGSILWSKAYGTAAESDYNLDLSASEIVNDVILHSNGSLYITGSTSGSMKEALSGTTNTWIGRVNANNGDIISATQFGAVTYPGVLAPTGDTYPISLVEGPGGNILVTGVSNGNFVQANAGGNDSWFLGFNPLTGL